MDWRGNQKRKSANRSDYCLGRLGMPGVLPMEICHIYHAIMSLTMHLRRWLGIPRDGITGIVMQGIYNVAPIRSIFHRAPPRARVNFRKAVTSLSQRLKKKRRKRLYRPLEKNYQHTRRGYYFENTRNGIFASGRIFENFENTIKHQRVLLSWGNDCHASVTCQSQ